MECELPADLKQFAQILDAQAPQVRELFHYAIAVLMIENGKAEVVETHTIDQREHITYRTAVGDVFTLVKPGVSEEWLETLKKMVRQVLREDRSGAERKESVGNATKAGASGGRSNQLQTPSAEQHPARDPCGKAPYQSQ